ncbi:murein transglycosylase [filamentous cyanobacterium CCP1]|nr:murein transglycosylase [filamentous cyanobacterium CCP2]PSB68038.1 murein transglycosylase [filamentous cyanobacterium CCP1]
MKPIAFCTAIALSLMALPLPAWANAVTVPLRRVEASEVSDFSTLLGLDDQLWEANGDRAALLTAIEHSLAYLQTAEAAAAYEQYPVSGITRGRVRRSLERFRQLLVDCRSAAELRTAVLQEFELYQSVGSDGQGTVDFTGYFEPVYQASRTPTAEYRYPLYRIPPDLEQWARPHPSRRQLEGEDGLRGTQGRLQGLELVWLRDRLEAYLVQVQGSARLQLTDGSMMSIGYAGRTDYPYVSIGRELVNDGKFREEELTLPMVIEYFQANPAALNTYLPRNDRFVFFRETTGTPATGSLSVPVTAERSIATDKTLLPPGALALIHTQIPYPDASGTLIPRLVSRYVLDQDTGGAIRGAGRVDIFMGTGELAGDRAGLINTPGELYYLLLKE